MTYVDLVFIMMGVASGYLTLAILWNADRVGIRISKKDFAIDVLCWWVFLSLWIWWMNW